MTAITEDVRKRAREVIVKTLADCRLSMTIPELTSSVAALILSEREAAQREERDRCAKIVERYQSFPPPTSRAARYHLQHCVKPNIAAAILQEPKE